MNEPDDHATDDADGGGRMLERFIGDPNEQSLSTDRQALLRSRVLAQAPRTCPAGMTTLRAEEGAWRLIAPGVAQKVLHIDRVAGTQTSLIRMSPGASVAGHQHPQDEECFILEGEILIGNHRLRTGDMHVASAGSIHEPTSSPAGAVLLLRAALDQAADIGNATQP